MLDEYAVEIDGSDGQRVVLAIAALRLIVLGRTLDEARALATAAVAFRSQASGYGGESSSLSSGVEDDMTRRATLTGASQTA